MNLNTGERRRNPSSASSVDYRQPVRHGITVRLDSKSCFRIAPGLLVTMYPFHMGLATREPVPTCTTSSSNATGSIHPTIPSGRLVSFTDLRSCAADDEDPCVFCCKYKLEQWNPSTMMWDPVPGCSWPLDCSSSQSDTVACDTAISYQYCTLSDSLPSGTYRGKHSIYLNINWSGQPAYT